MKKIITDRFKYIDVRQILMTNQFIVTQYYLNDFIKKVKNIYIFFKNACPQDKYLSTFIKSVCYFKINPNFLYILKRTNNYQKLKMIYLNKSIKNINYGKIYGFYR